MLFITIINFSDNGQSFENKMQQLVSRVSGFVGLPTLAKKAKKFHLNKVTKLFISIFSLSVINSFF